MGIGTFVKLVRAMETDANDLLGTIPEQGKEPCRDIARRIRCLGVTEQEVVFRTVETLAENLRQYR